MGSKNIREPATNPRPGGTKPAWFGLTITDVLEANHLRIGSSAEGKQFFQAVGGWQEAKLMVGVHGEIPAGVDAGQGGSRLVLTAAGSPLVFVDVAVMGPDMRQAIWQQLRQLTLIAHDAGRLIPSLAPEGKWLANLHCLTTMARLLENRAYPPGEEEKINYDLPSLASRYCPELVGQGNPARWLQPLFQKLLAQVLMAGLAQVWRLEQQVIPVVHRMKTVGIGVDRHRLEQVRADYSTQSDAAGQECRHLLGQSNLNLDDSTAVVAAFKGQDIDLESTAAEDLCQVSHPAADALRRYRECRTVVRDAEQILNNLGADGRIHPDWDQFGAGTGRMTCTKPSVQSLSGNPDLRSCLVPSPGHVFVHGDYAQADLRPLAYAAQDPAMLEVFRSGADFHQITAASLLGKAPAEVTADERKLSKAVTFGLVNGIGTDALCRQARLRYGLVWDTRQAKDYLDRFFSLYQGLAAFREQVKTAAMTSMECRTLFQRRRLLPSGSDYGYFRFIRTVNLLAQGSVADAMKLAMVEVDKQVWGQANIVANFHDALVMETPEDLATDMSGMLREKMEAALAKHILGVPASVDIQTQQSLAK